MRTFSKIARPSIGKTRECGEQGGLDGAANTPREDKCSEENYHGGRVGICNQCFQDIKSLRNWNISEYL